MIRAVFISTLMIACLSTTNGLAQVNDDQNTVEEEESTIKGQVEIKPGANDEEIRQRILKILTATKWFTNIDVKVTDGVVFLHGEAETVEQRKWAGSLARNTQDVTAVVNEIDLIVPDIWDYDPAINNVQNLWKNILKSVPTVVFAVLVLIFFGLFSLLVSKAFRRYLVNRNANPLLQEIISRTIATIVFLIGIYVIFYVADLTRVALTVLGGTGLLGIILGIAFRNITENFLASVFLSIQHPFENGDLVNITGHTGYVQRMTIRATLLLTLDGNHMQVPNSTVYKSNIINYSSNPSQRNEFKIRIAYNDDLALAQEIGMNILEEHPAVLRKPEPWVLIDELTASDIIIRFYFWVDGIIHNPLKVRSSLQRMIKHAFDANGISLPEGVTQITFPKGIPSGSTEKQVHEQNKTVKTKTEEISTKAEGDLKNDADEIKEQAGKARLPEEGEDLLKR